MSMQHYVLEAQYSIHKKIAQQAPFSDIQQAIIDMVSHQLPDALVSLMRLDSGNKTLSLAASNGLSEAYCQAVQKIPIGPDIASCGACAFLSRVVITEHVERDPHWHFFLEHTRAEGIVACWSAPVLSVEDEVIGTFATYYRHPKTPTPDEVTILTQAAELLTLAITYQEKRAAVRVQEQRFSSLFTQHPDPVYEFDLAGYFVNWNAAMTQLVGISPANIAGQHYLTFVDEADHLRTQDAFAEACRGIPQYYELNGRGQQGKKRRYAVTKIPIIVDGQVQGVYGAAHDITLQETQKESLNLLGRGIEATPNGVVMADARAPDLPLVYCNQAFQDITGYTQDEVLGHNCRFLQGPDTDPNAVIKVRTAINEQKECRVTLLNYRKDGTPFWNAFSLAPVLGSDGRCTHFVGIQQDVTQQRENEQALRLKQSYDPLTKLLNWTGFAAELANTSQRQPLAVLVINLDGFKSINDGISHYIGNCLLKAVAERLINWVQPDDILARIGGDDFCLALKNRTEHEVAQAAESILMLLSRPFMLYEHVLHISASIGISSREEDRDNEKYIQHANIAMREAKLQGRNTWHWYRDTISGKVIEHIALRRDIQEAIEQQQFVVHYQPLIDAQTGLVCSIEALVRWQHPKRGLLSPIEFLPLAQQTGQIVSIDQWILRQACRDTVMINMQRATPLTVAVNIYPLLFRRSHFFQDVTIALEESGLAPHLLELEVTEDVLMSGTKKVIEQLAALRALGVQVVIDDFGTGYSSLSYLRELPITKVKLDRSFIKEVNHIRDNAAIVQGVITMAHHLALKVVAEGVETKAEQQYLMQCECDYLQGYLFSRPIPLQQFMTLPLGFKVA